MAKGKSTYATWYCTEKRTRSDGQTIVCNRGNYITTYNKKEAQNTLKEKQKHCPKCRKHTKHSRKDTKS